MLLRFVKDYRSRAWMFRAQAGAVVDVQQPEVTDEAVSGGFAVPVEPEPSPVVDEAVGNNDSEDDGA